MFWGVTTDHQHPDISYIILREPVGQNYFQFFGLTEWLNPSNSDFVFWAEESLDSVARARYDGSDMNLNFIPGCNSIMSVTTDGTYIYWIDFYGQIGRAKYDGTEVNQTWIDAAAHFCWCITLDDNYIYWTNYQAIGRANLDGTGVNSGFVWGITYIATELAVDDNYIYWGITDGRISRVEKDGSNIEDNFIFTSGPGVEPHGLAVDDDYIYWSEGGLPNICRGNIDGTGIDYSWLTGCSEPISIQVDDNFVFWINRPTDCVGRANIDGTSHVTQSWITGLDNGRGFALGNIACLHDGDVVDDDTITAGDAQLAFAIALGMYIPSVKEECAADCNSDGNISAGDAQQIFGVLFGGACTD